MLKYEQLRDGLKRQIQKGELQVGDLLPSENELCEKFSITRTTVRKALDELLKEGFIEKHKGKGSCVIERRKSLGLLNVKGFSEAAGGNVKTVYLQKPVEKEWDGEIYSPINIEDKQEICLFFERLRYVEDFPVMFEKNWFSGKVLPGFLETEFTEGSFFKTLSKKYLIEVVGSSSELRAEFADEKVAGLLKVASGAPVLHISIKFKTSNPKLTIYSELYCNTEKYPIANNYSM